MTPLDKALAKIDELTAGEADWQPAAMCRGLMVGYDARWWSEQREIRLRATEECFASKLVNIATGKPSRTWSLVGLLDKTAEDGDGIEIFDHKTTTYEIEDPSGFYWQHLAVESQPSMYELLAMLNGVRVTRVTWDVTRKPAIRPKEITKKDHAEAFASGHYCGFQLSQGALTHLANDKRENAELYQHRVARDAIENPDRFYARRNVPRTRQQLAEYATELWQIGGQIRDARNSQSFPRNSGACYSYNRPCVYLPICSGYDTPDSDRWQPKTKREGSVGGKDVLSHSRIKTWQSCPRKYQLSYEAEIERVREERDEALVTGSLWGAAMDSYWTSFNEERLNDGNSNGA
jgi:hypothetical protein